MSSITPPTKTPRYWRSLDELEQSPQFREFLHREFPQSASELPEGVSRRRWLQLMGASFALASAAGCRWETERFAPLSERPEGRIPGKPEHYATNVSLAGRPYHLLVTNYEGRPIKVEGNPDHPEGAVGADGFAQAATLTLYDPDRLTRVIRREEGSVFAKQWADFEAWLRPLRQQWQQNEGEGLAVLMRPTRSLAEAAQLTRLAELYPQARWYQYDPLDRSREATASEAAFGQPLQPVYRLGEARVVACFDADPLHEHPAAVRHIRDFSARRDPDGEWMNRLYCFESQFSITGAAADHRLPLKSADIAGRLRQLRELVEQRLEAGGAASAERSSDDSHEESHDESHDHGDAPRPATPDEMLAAAADDLAAHRGASLVLVGPQQPAEVHAEAYLLNERLGNLGKTLAFREPLDLPATASLKQLIADVDGRMVDTLFVLGGNPAYDAPGALQLGQLLPLIPRTARLGYYDDETAELCHWSLPETHPFEAWGDVVGLDGTPGVAQPLIEPLAGGRSQLELLLMLGEQPSPQPQQVVREAVEARLGRTLSQEQWDQLLHDGYGTGEVVADVTPQPSPQWQPAALTPTSESLELVFLPSRTIYDGSFANNAWLQETPDPLTKLTWDNAAIVAPVTAAEIGVAHGDVVVVQTDGRSVELPVYVLPGQAPRSVGLALGYGRTSAGTVGGLLEEDAPPVGCDVNVLRPADGALWAGEASVTPAGRTHPLATTQDHHAIDQLGLEEIGRRTGELVREGSLENYREHPDFAQHMTHAPPPAPLWEEPSYEEGRAWGMSIDLSRCIGCNACMVACQAENNVPVVGKDQVIAGREMHWIRIDRYFQGEPENPSVANQPVACQQCENAPCEQVCPVAATVHSDEGLNDMVYNRCIGTRYCANNCPYKVRRFNFFNNINEFSEPNRQLAQLVLNPSVTVRSRGVMEKCTYCVQRISSARITAKVEGRPIRDGEVVTACQQACPAQAIEFGDLNQQGSRVAEAHASPRAYGMLAELNVKPRTAYLARIRNPHPRLAALEGADDSHAGDHASHG